MWGVYKSNWLAFPSVYTDFSPTFFFKYFFIAKKAAILKTFLK